MGQVWSKADFDGMTELFHEGGCGSVLAVTSQNLGRDAVLGTQDDVLAPLNRKPVMVSMDIKPGPNARDNNDRVRAFYSFHAEGAYFVMGDGSVHFISESIEAPVYQALSTIAGGEIASVE